MGVFIKKILTVLFSLVFMVSFLAPTIFAAGNNRRVICSKFGNVFEIRITEQDDPLFDENLLYCCVRFYGFISDEMEDKNLFELLTDDKFYYESSNATEVNFFSKFVDEFAKQKKFIVEFRGTLPVIGDQEGILILKRLAQLKLLKN